MKIDLEPLLDNFEKRRYKDRDKSLVVYELVGNGVGVRRQQYVSLVEYYGTESAEDVNGVLRSVVSVSNDIGILFDGQASLFNILYSDTLGEFLGSGHVKTIRAGNHFDEESGVESIDPMAVLMVYTMLNMMLEKAREYIEELNLTRFVVSDLTAMHLAEGFVSCVNMEYLVLSDLGCSELSLTILIRGLVSSMNNLRFLDVSKNKVSRQGASLLKEVLGNHPKLVFLNVGHCEMDLHSLDLILDGCEVTRQMQSLVVESTVASSVEGMNSIERRLRSGSLCLLNIKFHDRDNVDEFIRRIRSYMARNYTERKNIELVKNNKLHRLELPEALESIVCSPDGVENMYKLLIADHSHLLDLFKVTED
jgi:hypothetical protein